MTTNTEAVETTGEVIEDYNERMNKVFKKYQEKVTQRYQKSKSDLEEDLNQLRHELNQLTAGSNKIYTSILGVRWHVGKLQSALKETSPTKCDESPESDYKITEEYRIQLLLNPDKSKQQLEFELKVTDENNSDFKYEFEAVITIFHNSKKCGEKQLSKETYQLNKGPVFVFKEEELSHIKLSSEKMLDVKCDIRNFIILPFRCEGK